MAHEIVGFSYVSRRSRDDTERDYATGQEPAISARPARRVSRRALLPALGGLLAAPGLTAGSRQGQRQRQATKEDEDHYQDLSQLPPFTIPDAGPATPNYPSTIRVRGFKRGKLRDGEVTLHGLTHTSASDLDVLLRATNGRRAIILSDAGYQASNVTPRLDDQATAPLPPTASTDLTSGRFRPTNNQDPGSNDPTGTDATFALPNGPGTTGNVRLATFKGSKPNGIWSLCVFDVDNVARGQLAGGWSLRIKAKVRK